MRHSIASGSSPSGAEHCHQQIRRLHIQIFLEATVVVERLVHHAQRDDGVDQVVVPGDLEVSGKDQCDAVTDGENSHELGYVFEGAQEKNDPKKE
jgi:hypothetical protein